MTVKKEDASVKRAISVSITPGTILTIFAIGCLAALVFYLRNLIPVFLAALYIAALVNPYANWGARLHLPKGVSVGILYIVGLLFICGVLILILPTLVGQVQEAFTNYPGIITGFFGNDPLVRAMINGTWFDLNLEQMIISVQHSGVQESLPQIVTAITNAFSGIVTGLLVLILAFYLVVDGSSIRGSLHLIMPSSAKRFVLEVLPIVKTKISLWLRGQLIIMITMFTITYISLSILGVPYALLLALLTGLLEIIPFLGPIIAAVPSIILAFTVSPVMAVLVAILYFVMEQLEGDLLTPKIMQQTIGLHPIVTIGSLLVGYEIGGVVGALLAVPTAMVVSVSLHEWHHLTSKKKTYARTTS
ncbi:MAG: AI-2E family transporter [Patescibacteria group bacterium]|jgi:predicted PurR-regulated permease PerM